MAKLLWREKLIAELEPGMASETEVARIERDDCTVPETLGLTLGEGERLTATTQAEIVRAQVSTMGERFRWCEHCGAKLLRKGYHPATFHSVFGDVGVRIRRLRACGCGAGQPEPKNFAAMSAAPPITMFKPQPQRESPRLCMLSRRRQPLWTEHPRSLAA